MEIQVLKNEKNCLEFKLIGERHTLPQLLQNKLLNDSNVEFASYKLEHPFDNDSLFIVKTKGKAPSKVLLDACTELEKELNSFAEKLKKAI